MKKNLGNIFYEISNQTPQNIAIALSCGNEISFSELNKISNQIARHLQSIGVSKSDLIFIEHNKSVIAFALMISCIKLGIIYANIDSNTPEDRLAKTLEKYQPKYYISQAPLKQKLPPKNRIHILNKTNEIDIKTLEIKAKKQHEANLGSIVTEFNTPIYLMFTSGSTGTPKGVLIQQGGLINFINWAREEYSITKNDKLTNLNPMHFDNSVFDFYASIFNSATLIPLSEKLVKKPRKALDVLNKLNPTIWFSVPSLLVFYSKMRAWKKNDLPNIKAIIFGGEGFPKSQLKIIWEFFGQKSSLFNVYGPTEGTCICSSYKVTSKDMEKEELLPLGKLIHNFNYQIVDYSGNGIQEGSIGELLISGPNIALGYYLDPEKTKISFKETDENSNDRVYKTGDLVKINKETGLLHFCGRKDNQVKRMGHRIELDEIEIAVGSLAGVIENATISYQDNDSNTRIVSFICSNTLTEEEVIEKLRKKIPYYMLPDKVIFKNSLLKNRNGKIDKRSLKEEIVI